MGGKLEVAFVVLDSWLELKEIGINDRCYNLHKVFIIKVYYDRMCSKWKIVRVTIQMSIYKYRFLNSKFIMFISMWWGNNM